MNFEFGQICIIIINSKHINSTVSRRMAFQRDADGRVTRRCSVEHDGWVAGAFDGAGADGATEAATVKEPEQGTTVKAPESGGT